MNKKRLLCMILSLTAVIGLMLVRDSAAWIDTKSGEPLPQTWLAKKMKLDFEGTLDSYLQYEDGTEFIISGQNLIWDNGGKITVRNHAEIPTNVRFRIVYDTPLGTGLVYAGGAEEHLAANVADGWTQGEDGYFYRDFAATTSPVDYEIVSDIHYDETKVTRELYLPQGEAPFGGSVRVEIQAKQSENVDWADVFTTGTP